MQAKSAESTNTVEVYQLHKAETSITFSQNDHPPVVPRPGHVPLVLDSQVGGYNMDRVFMDGGSSMNIIFVKHPTEDVDPAISMEEIKHRSTRGSPRGSGHIPWSRPARSC